MQRIVNIEIYEENEMVKVSIDLFSQVGVDQCHLLPDDNFRLKTNLTGIYNNSVNNYAYQVALIASLERSHPLSCDAAFENVGEVRIVSNNTIRLSAVYTLSLTPHVAINWLVCFSIYINKLGNKVNMTFINDRKNLEKMIQEVGDIDKEKLENKNIKNTSMKCFLIELSKFNHLANYKPTIEMVTALKNYYIANRESSDSQPLIACLEINKKFSLFWPAVLQEIDKVFDPNCPKEEKDSLLMQFAKTFIKNNPTRNDELSYIFKNIELLARQKLFQTCIGRKAHDKGMYNWSYTEWTIVMRAKFVFYSEEKVAISDISNNLGYQTYYALGKGNYSIYEDEIKFLANVLDIKILPDCDLRQEIVFTPEASKKLIANGLLCSEKSIKDMLYLNNQYSFFGKSKYQDPNTNIGIISLPEEIQEKIIQYTR